VTVDLSAASGKLNTEWLDAASGTPTRAEPTEGGRRQTLKAPFAGDAVLYLWKK
jgi:hypothetical protein